jgi:prepilin-type N-terminal cleavage/methylation domain-containing protein
MKKYSIKSFIKAFTLVELLVVVAIISLLTGIIITNLTSSKTKSRDSKRVSDMAQIQLALSLYFDRCNEYPDATLDTPSGGYYLDVNKFNGCPQVGGVPVVTLKSYIDKIPTTPSPGSNYPFYWYNTNKNGSPASTKSTDYLLFTRLEKPNADVVKNGLDGNPSWWGGQYCSNLNCPDGAYRCYCLSPK